MGLARRSIRLTVFAVVCALGPLVVLAALTTQRSDEMVRKEVSRRLERTTTMSAQLLSAEMRRVTTLVDFEAKQLSVSSALPSANPETFDLRTVDNQLQLMLTSTDGIASVGLVSVDGTMLTIPGHPDLVGNSYTDRDWYRGLIGTGSTYVSEAFPSSQAGHPYVVTIASYVMQPALPQRPAAPLAILVVALRLDEVQAVAEGVAERQGVDVWLADQHGTLLATPSGRPPELRKIADDAIAPAAKVRAGQLATLDVSGTKNIVVHNTIEPLGWTVYAAIPRAQAYADAARIQRTVLWITLPLGVVVCIGIALLVQLQRRQWRSEAALAAARDEANAASEQKSAFLANMSHEIRTPMNGVIGMTTLLLGTELDGTQREYAETAARSAEALLEVIDDVLDFSKVEAGRMELERTHVDLRSIIEDVAQLLSATAETKGIDLLCHVDAGVPTIVWGDPGRIRQILMNLVGNAVKFTDQGEVVTHATVEPARDGMIDVRFEVRDSGIGIAPEKVAGLFDAFTQADVSTTRQYGGTGLGLAITQRLVALMDGQIDVQSELGLGSSFSVTIPFEPGPGALGLPPEPRADLVGLRALVVDDHATARSVLTGMLEGWRLRSEATDQADDALVRLRHAAAAADPFMFALVDRNMPGRDGVWLTRAIRGAPELSGLRIVMLTSSRPDEARAARRAGADAVLTKPVRLGHLHETLASMLSEPVASTSGRAIGPVPGGVERHSGRLLLAEDNEVNVKVATAMLTQLGYEVHVVRDGAAAVTAATTDSFDAVLMDCQMPVLDGYAATEQIRTHEGGATRLPIIALTASALESDRQRCVAAGMDFHLAKPIRLESLQATLAAAIPSDIGSVPGAPLAPDQTLLAESVEERLRELTGGTDADLARELRDIYAQTTPAQLASLHEAVAAGDVETVREVAHAMKGAAGNLGAADMAETCLAIEEHAKKRELGEIDELVADLARRAEDLRRVLERLADA